MKQVVINTTGESEPVTIKVFGPEDEHGTAGVLHSEKLPGERGNTAVVLGIQEGQTLVIS